MFALRDDICVVVSVARPLARHERYGHTMTAIIGAGRAGLRTLLVHVHRPAPPRQDACLPVKLELGGTCGRATRWPAQVWRTGLDATRPERGLFRRELLRLSRFAARFLTDAVT